MRHLFTQSLGLRLRDREEVAMVLGDGAVNAGALCHKISRDTPGVGYVLGEDNRPIRVRAGFVSDDMIRSCAQRFRAPRQIPIVVPVVELQQRPPSRPRSPRTRAASNGTAR
jgi:S-DNA-T family DNA segregation ATPase FtsK/SpoIIIE